MDTKFKTVEYLLDYLNKAVEQNPNVLHCRVECYHDKKQFVGGISVCGEHMKEDGTTGVLLLCFK